MTQSDLYIPNKTRKFELMAEYIVFVAVFLQDAGLIMFSADASSKKDTAQCPDTYLRGVSALADGI